MGMYTECLLMLELDGKRTPKIVSDTLQYMVSGDDAPKPDVMPDHKLFGDTRWRWMLQGSSYYFDGQPMRTFRHDDIAKGWFLTSLSNIKNYDNEWELMLNWLTPCIASEGHIGHIRYEEDEHPTILYFEDGRVVKRSVNVG